MTPPLTDNDVNVAEGPFDDAMLIMETLFDIRANTVLIIELIREDDGKEEEEQENAEEWAAWKARSEDLTRRLEAAIARRKAEAARRAAGESSSA